MRVVFLQDVPHVAKAGEVKEVANGYARNFLFPRKLALLARPQALSQIGTAQRVEAQESTELTALAQQIEGKEITIKAKTGAKDKLYGSITSTDIAAELNKSTGLAIDKRKIELEEPIHHLGNYEIAIKLAKDVLPKIRVSVTEEEAKVEEKPPKKKKAVKTEAKAPKEEKKTAKKAAKVTKKAEKVPKKEEKTPKKAKKAPEKKKASKKKEKA